MATNRYGLFQQEAPKIMGALMARFGLTVEEAAAILGNLGHESGAFKQMQELRPTVQGSAGGLGIAQWTGPRRRQYTTFCSAKGLDSYTVNAGTAFLIHELETTERRGIPAVKRPGTLEDKVKAFENAFERSGVKSYASRNKFAHLALDAYAAKPVVVPVEPSPGLPADPTPEHKARQWAEQTLAPFEIKAIQQRLHALGLGSIVGPVDGLIGPHWAAALSALQYRAGLTVDGRYGPATKEVLARGFDQPLPKEPSMEAITNVLTSKTLIGIAVAALSPLLSKYGVTDGTIAELVQAVGLALATLGRVTATKTITGAPLS